MRLIHGVDLSNWNGELTPSIVAALRSLGIDHAVIRASLETADKRALALRQIDALLAGGITVSVYVWCYADWDPRQTIRDTKALLAGRAICFMALDLEDVDSFTAAHLTAAQSVAWVLAALDEIRLAGSVAVLYTAHWCFRPICGDDPAIAATGVLLWVAEYDGVALLTVWTPFAGFTQAQVIGKQYLGNGTAPPTAGLAADLDVFDAETIDPPAPAPAPAVQPLAPAGALAMIDQLAYCIQWLSSTNVEPREALQQTHDRAAAVAAQAAGLLAGGSA